MTSNAYIATDSETVMKVGKANDVKRRERELSVRITRAITCLDEEAAYRIENQLRVFVIKNGGIRHQQSIDWFKFDPQIYAMLYEFAAALNNESVNEIDLETEIAQYIMSYHKILLDEANAKIEHLSAENAHLQYQIEPLRQDNAEQSERVHKLNREIGTLRGKFEVLKEKLEKGATKEEIDHFIEIFDRVNSQD
jgi:SMC interacting uncharacterized protein involved in chromosome segregation